MSDNIHTTKRARIDFEVDEIAMADDGPADGLFNMYSGSEIVPVTLIDTTGLVERTVADSGIPMLDDQQFNMAEDAVIQDAQRICPKTLAREFVLAAYKAQDLVTCNTLALAAQLCNIKGTSSIAQSTAQLQGMAANATEDILKLAEVVRQQAIDIKHLKVDVATLQVKVADREKDKDTKTDKAINKVKALKTELRKTKEELRMLWEITTMLGRKQGFKDGTTITNAVKKMHEEHGLPEIEEETHDAGDCIVNADDGEVDEQAHGVQQMNLEE